jgi:hypothetical protein
MYRLKKLLFNDCTPKKRDDPIRIGSCQFCYAGPDVVIQERPNHRA